MVDMKTQVDRYAALNEQNKDTDSKLFNVVTNVFISDGRCERFIDWSIVANVPPAHEPAWPSVTAVAYRTNILAKIYLLLSTIWIIASLLLIGEQNVVIVGAMNYCFMQNIINTIRSASIFVPICVYCETNSKLHGHTSRRTAVALLNHT